MKSGFVSIVGRPNVGKSTLLNRIIGEKIAIVTDKPQTTRTRIQGIFTNEQGQIIFVDTPGVHRPKHLLGEYMVKVFSKTIQETDIVYYVIDVTKALGSGEKYILDHLQQVSASVFLLANKIDLVTEKQVEDTILEYKDHMNFSSILPVSAALGTNLEQVLSLTYALLPEGPMYYPAHDISDQPVHFLAAEFIREKALQLTRDEVPHSLAVGIEEFTYREKGSLYIRAIIYTERSSQKGIVIGKNGSMLKNIGEQARRDIEASLKCPVYLDLWVKEKQNWRDNEGHLSKLGYRQ